MIGGLEMIGVGVVRILMDIVYGGGVVHIGVFGGSRAGLRVVELW